MRKIPVFQAEKDAGLESHVSQTSSAKYSCVVQSPETVDLTEAAIAALPVPENAKAGENNNELVLFPLNTILVTVGWNLNDDVFDAVEVWAARHSPKDTPFNYQHKCDQIIGHITSNKVVDEALVEVPDDSTIDNLPAKFHIQTSAVLYKTWDKADLQERMDGILEKIAAGKLFVSMECYFRGFDYAMKEADGTVRVIARNEKTAFLTKHLRAYGGNGEFQGKKVGRVLRSITYSGKGLVDVPANPESLILSTASESYIRSEEIFSDLKSLGYSELMKKDEVLNELTESNTVTIEEIQKQLDEAKAAHLVEVEKLKAEVAKATKELAEEVEKGKVAVATLAEKEKQLTAASAELDGIKTVQKQADRLAKLKAAFKVGDDNTEVVELNKSLAGLTDEAFDEYVKVQAKFTPAPLAPQSTPAQLPPQSTTAPAPLKGATAALVETVTTVETPTLSSVPETDKTQALRTSIASLFGEEEAK